VAVSAPRSSKTAGLVDPTESSAEPFRTLRVALELVPDSRRGNLVLFTSAASGEGKSTVAANYALVSAVNDRRVLLVDADLRHPSQHNIFGVPRSPGLTEVLLSRLDVHTLMQPIEGVPGLSVMTAGMPAPRAGDMASSSALRDLLVKASAEFDIVAVDTPPMLAGTDAANIAAHADVNVVFVVNKDQRTRRVDQSLAKLQLVGANIVGFVVNREGRLSQYGYG
jgi:capsular exopolysaccharide synthesis family protein